MKCETPIWIEQEGNLKKGVEVPCGKCIYCLEQKRSIWTWRILQELEVAETARFVTLTYDEWNVPYGNNKINNGKIRINELPKGRKLREGYVKTLKKEDISKWLKGIRNEIMREWREAERGRNKELKEEAERYVKKSEISGKWSPKLRYFVCGEYGSKEKTERPHYHAIIYNVPLKWYKWDPIHKEWYSDKLEKMWGKGNIKISEVERASAHYTAKYTIKYILEEWDEDDVRVRPYATMSKKPGIGANYINDENRNYHIGTETNYTRLKGGYIQPIGRYYKDKIWPKEKETWEYEYEHDKGKTNGETTGIRLRDENREQTNKKNYKYAKRKEEAKKELYTGEADGDINEAERRIRREDRELYETNYRRANKDNLKGKI